MLGKAIKKKIAYCLCGIMIFAAGCGSEIPEAPKLNKPVAVNESYRPVEKGDVGDIKIYSGVIVPTDYCHFYTTSIKIAEINVSVGDYVEAGAVLAEADIEATTQAIASINSQKSLNAKVWEIKCKIYEQNKKELEYKLKGAQELRDTDMESQLETSIAVLNENHSFDEIFYNHQQSALDKQLSEYAKIQGNGSLVASHSGYVTYIKDLADSDMVNGCENIVVISDYNDCYIEVLDTDKSKKLEKNYPVIYTEIGGQKYNLKEYEYLPEELHLAQSRTLSPTLRLKYESEGKELVPGTNLPVFFQKTITEDVLVVGNDSLYQDEKGDFVYVKNGEGKEIRYVELGDVDTFYSEVVSGLSEGEMVYYSSDSVLPENYQEYVVDYSDFKLTDKSDFYTIKDTTTKKFYSEYEGQIESVAVTQGQEVNVGELICVIRTNEGSATLTEMYNNIINFKAAHVANVKAFDESITAKEDEIEAAYIARQAANNQAESAPDATTGDQSTPATPTDAVPTATSTDAQMPITSEDEVTQATSTDANLEATPGDAQEPPSPYLYEELNCQLEVIKLNKQLEEVNYLHQLTVMETEYNKVSCNNDGNGAINIYAKTSGKVSNLNLKVGKNVKQGDRLFNIETPADSMVELRVKETLQINQQVEFVKGDSSYKGTVVGVNGNDNSFYFTEIDNKVYISTNSGQQARYFVKMDNQGFYDLKNDYVAKYAKSEIKEAIVIPGHMVYQETKVKSGVGNVTYNYVWKQVNGELVKQYVQSIGPVGGKDNVCILSGVNQGDILAQEFIEVE